jgi:hypothetical protein
MNQTYWPHKAVARYRGLVKMKLACAPVPGVTLRFTPDFMPPPAPQAG